MSGTQNSPSVDVVWWNATSLWIQCPYCDEVHGHGFVSYESAFRLPHCAFRRPSYQFHFPVAYEINKTKALFVNISSLQLLEEEESDDMVSFSDKFSNMILSSTRSGPRQNDISFDDSTETITIQLRDEEPFEQRRILLAISDCVNGDVSRVMDYLKSSPDKSIFLNGISHDEDTCLIMASREQSSSMVSLLLDNGAEIDAANKAGRTALMEASIWGRLDTAKILIARGANRDLRDNKNKSAFDLAQSTRKNQEERYIKAGGILGDASRGPAYKEDVFNRDADRREIARILEGTKVQIRTDREPQASEAAHHSFRRSSDGQSIIHCGPIQEYPISSPTKTVAVLERGKPFPTIAAMSGWGHTEWLSTRVSGKDWTERVLKVAAIVGHTLSPDFEKDQGVPGQFQASHAEKQLIALFLDRHVFLPEDKIPDPCLDNRIAGLEDRIARLAARNPVISQLYQLQHQKNEVEYELFDKDDRLLGEEYDEQLVGTLKTKTATLDKEIASLENRSEVKTIRTLERQIQAFEHEKKVHDRLNRISKILPKNTLTRATILISAPRCAICEDCMSFKNRVNRFFGLSIELHECTQ